MKLLDAILLSLAAGFFIIGVHQLITVGLAQAYWIFMLSTVLLIWYQIRKKSQKEHLQNLENNPKSKKSAGKRTHL
jgi:4-hydroxybenzoate polyprenyltransferase